MSNPKTHLEPIQQPNPGPPSPLSDSLRGLFSKVGDLFQGEQLTAQEQLNDLITDLVESELSKKKRPTAERIRKVISESGSTIEHVQREVATEVELRSLQVRVDAGRTTADDHQAAQDALRAFHEETEQIMQSRIAKADQLAAKVSDTRTALDEHNDRGNRLRQAMIDSGRIDTSELQSVKAQIVETIKREHLLRSRAAGSVLLPEKYIANRSDPELTKQIEETKAERDELQRRINNSNAQPGTTAADYKIPSVLQHLETLERKQLKEQRLYDLGAEVAAVRDELRQLEQRREQLNTGEQIATIKGN